MSQKYTKIGFQNIDGKITALELCSDSGELSITGKVLNNLYNSTILAKQLIKEGTNSNITGRIDVSNIVGIDSYTWGVAGINLGVGYKVFSSSSKFLELFSNDHKLWYQYLYMFSESDNEWQVASSNNPTFRSLASEL
jgi:hypothetical protein